MKIYRYYVQDGETGDNLGPAWSEYRKLSNAIEVAQTWIGRKLLVIEQTYEVTGERLVFTADNRQEGSK